MESWNWYISIEAIRQYMEIQNWSGELEVSNPLFLRAKEELRAFSLTAREVDTPLTKPARSGAVLYRANGFSRGVKARWEFSVSFEKRGEGNLPQLVRVRLKDAGQRRGGR